LILVKPVGGREGGRREKEGRRETAHRIKSDRNGEKQNLRGSKQIDRK
jgi:hypothetical protein